MALQTYSHYFELATAAYKYVKAALYKGAGNRILSKVDLSELVVDFQPGSLFDRANCLNQLRENTLPLRKQWGDQLAKRVNDYAEKTWGKDEQGKVRTDSGTLGLYSKTEFMKSNGEIIELNAKYALQHACGNCEEFSSLTFKFLKDRDVRPIDWMKQNGYMESVGGFGNHVFVIVGRDKKTDAGNIDTWNKEVVWCDPYEDEIGGLELIRKRFGGKELSLRHRWDAFAP